MSVVFTAFPPEATTQRHRMCDLNVQDIPSESREWAGEQVLELIKGCLVSACDFSVCEGSAVSPGAWLCTAGNDPMQVLSRTSQRYAAAR